MRHALRIRRRKVSWGPEGTVPSEHQLEAWAVDSSVLISEVARKVEAIDCAAQFLRDPERAWEICIDATRASSGQGWVTAGDRMATTCVVGIEHQHVDDVHWIEATSVCWASLFPTGMGDYFAQITSPIELTSTQALSDALTGMCCVRGVQVQQRLASYSVAPSFATSPAEERRIAIGSGALVLDPLCGDGVAVSIQMGILAAAAFLAIERGEAKEYVYSYYNWRLAVLARAHLLGCSFFYSQGPRPELWAADLEACDSGIQRLDISRPLQMYHLRGFSLVRE